MYQNKYFLLRHGKNVHQTSKQDIVYGYPDDSPPCELVTEGIVEAKRAGEFLLGKSIDLIISSDTLRTRQTAEIVADIIGYRINEIIFDKRLRDKNWGIFGGHKKTEVWEYYLGDKLKAFDVAPLNGETWTECQKRIVEVFLGLENKYSEKNILIVSHSNPLWLLDGYIKGLSNQQMLDNYQNIIRTGEIRELI